MDWKTLLPIILPSLVTGILGLLARSPIAKDVPAPIAKILAKLNPVSVQELVDHLGSKEARHDTAVDMLVRVASKQGIALTDATAGQVVLALEKLYKKTRKR